MKKNFILLIMTMLSLFVLTDCEVKDKNAGSPPDILHTEQGTETPGEQGELFEAEPFSNIDVDVLAGDITVVEGDDYSLRYRLHSREQVVNCKVENDTLYFLTSLDAEYTPEENRPFIIVTVPRKTELVRVRLESGSGNIGLAKCEFDYGNFRSASGNINLTGVSCRTVDAEVASGDILLSGDNIKNCELETVSGKINVSESVFFSLECKTVSEKILVSDCRILDEAEFESTSGNISSKGTEFNSIEAFSYGEIIYNGETEKHQLSINNGEPELCVKSVSGNIVIDTIQ